MQERPGEAEHGAPVLRAEITPEEAAEQLAVPEEIAVDVHRGDCRAAADGLGCGARSLTADGDGGYPYGS